MEETLTIGRHLAAWLGMVPRQHSSGDRRVMMGIRKRGSQHLEHALLVHGARAVVRVGQPKNRSAQQLGQRTSGAARGTTVPRLRSPTRTHGSSGPCFEVVTSIRAAA